MSNLRYFKDITGLRSGKLVAVSISHQNERFQYVWNCVCDCGGSKKVRSMNLVQGRVKSCGCLPLGRPKKVMAQGVTV